MIRSGLVLLLVLSFPQSVWSDEEPSTELQSPESWKQFFSFRMNGNFPGTWLSEGETQALWAGIPAGVSYQTTGKCQISHAGNGFQESHEMKTADGKILSRGSSHIFWDEESSQVKGHSSGFDGGKPYSGTLTLIGIDQAAGVEKWSYRETSRGTTEDYVIQRTSKDSNLQETIFSCPGKGTEWKDQSHRRNPVAEHFSQFDIMGVWEAKLPNGSRWQFRNEWALGGRVVRGANVQVETDEEELQVNTHLIYWDASRGRLVFQGVGETGASWRGEIVSLSQEGDTSTRVTRYRGVTETGVSMAGTLTMKLKGDQLTRIFSDFSFGDGRVVPDEVYQPLEFQRVSK